VSEKKKICFIINPISGVGKQRVLQKLVPKLLDKNLYDFKLLVTKEPGHATELATQAVKDGCSMVVVSGGDGSINEVARALQHTNVPLAIIPTGSGNGLARDLNIPLDIEKAIQLLNTGKERWIDLGEMNGKLFVNVAGVGFDGFVADAFSKYGKRGFWSYVKVTLKSMPKYKSEEVELQVNGLHLKRRVFSMTVANSRQFGSDAIIAANAKIDDGILDLVVINEFPWYLTPILVGRMFLGNLHKSSYYETFQSKQFHIKTRKGLVAQMDGDPYHFSEELTISVLPLKLKLIVPQGA